MRDTQLSWRTLYGYARAVSAFSKSVLPDLTRASFERLASAGGAATSNADHVALPPHEAFATSDNYPLAYRHYGSRSTRRVVILVHGAGCFGDQMHALAQHLSLHDIADVYTLDMRGHGLSPGRPGHAVDEPRQMITDVADFIAFAARRHNGSPIVLGGHSAGGGLVLAISRSPLHRLVSAYFFLAPFLGLGSPVNRPYFGGWVRLRGVRLRLLSLLSALGVTRFNGNTVVEFAPAARALDKRYIPSWSFNTTLAFGPGLWVEKKQPIGTDVPVLVLSGDNDECFNASLYPAAFKIVAPHAEVCSMGAIGHWDLLVDPAMLNAVERWLARQGVKRAGAPRIVKASTY
jgi:alpha-beta hydrolase superfamily lysophospholipase